MDWSSKSGQERADGGRQGRRGSYAGVQQVDAVQALAAVNATFDATQRRLPLAHG